MIARVSGERAPASDMIRGGFHATCAAFDEVMERPAAHGIVNTTTACAGRAIFDQDPTPVGDPATYFFYHEGHPSTAVHRIVGKKLFEEIVARPPAGR